MNYKCLANIPNSASQIVRSSARNIFNTSNNNNMSLPSIQASKLSKQQEKNDLQLQQQLKQQSFKGLKQDAPTKHNKLDKYQMYLHIKKLGNMYQSQYTGQIQEVAVHSVSVSNLQKLRCVNNLSNNSAELSIDINSSFEIELTNADINMNDLF
ncbi:Hypothetical_protein [Hexamita inflata]|uniref:Hypothetical_protein n=1 Tax=Hexamita inflata TaxID=28002 RepID=A0ABP1HC44_9EUKA